MYQDFKQGQLPIDRPPRPMIDSLRRTYRPMGNFDHVHADAVPNVRATSHPISLILAVQLLDGGDQKDPEGGTYYTFELNLVFKEAERSRLNLSNHTDLAWTYAAADQLARFLGVPLLDHLESP